MNHIELGQAGENIAVNHLISIGHKIIERNYTWIKSEIDIVSKFDNQLIVTEVKTRNSEALGKPYLSVNSKKQKQIIKVTNQYIIENDVQEEIRFDVISIVLNRNRMNLEHIENAFYPLR